MIPAALLKGSRGGGMIPQIAKRQIGTVTILDIKGQFTGQWALKTKKLLDQEIAFSSGKQIVFNMAPTSNLDTLGARFLFESVPQNKEMGILSGKSSVMQIINRLDINREFYRFKDEHELVSHFGNGLVSDLKEKNNRKAIRIQTALPLEFYYLFEGDRFKFKAIVTNLSETGLFAEYIDLETAEESLIRLNPYNFKILHLTLTLPKRKSVRAEGKVVHTRMDGEQVGIGIHFERIDEKDRIEIKRFLNTHSGSQTSRKGR